MNTTNAALVMQQKEALYIMYDPLCYEGAFHVIFSVVRLTTSTYVQVDRNI